MHTTLKFEHDFFYLCIHGVEGLNRFLQVFSFILGLSLSSSPVVVL
jgi:hypothetical protein